MMALIKDDTAKIGNKPTRWTKFTPRLSLWQILNEVCGVEYLHANTPIFMC